MRPLDTENRSQNERSGRSVLCLLSSFLCLALSGCALLDQRQAELMATGTFAVPEAWSSSPPGAAAPAALAAWWRQFGDEQLEHLIDAALEAAPDLRSARARLRQARASRDLAVANLYPSLDASGGATRSRSGGESPQTLYNATFDARWEPPIFGGRGRGQSGVDARFALR
ncbi:MAG: TolC family protein [Azoarcus sp.]|jgi:outer membrane protein TolC|nr:TolC family protein [Azoarcus sp.]